MGAVEDNKRGGCPKWTQTVVVRKEFVPEGKTVEFCKGVMDRLLKHIHWFVQLCSALKIFSCCTMMCLPTKLLVFANFRPQKMLQSFITPSTLKIYLCQAIFCSPS
jgi:hypothetical protein